MENQKKTTNSLARRMGISLICGLAAGLLLMMLRENLNSSGQEAVWKTINSILFQDITAAGAEKDLGLFYILGQLFIRSLQLVIVPMVFTSITLAIGQISDTRALGRISFKTIGGFLVCSAMALVLACGAGYMIYSAGLFNIQVDGLEGQAGSTGANPLNVILSVVPSNVAATFSSNTSVLAIVFLAVTLGLCMNAMGEERTSVLKKLITEINDIVVVFLNYVVTKFGPIAIFVLLSRTFAIYGIHHLKPAMTYVVATTILLLAFLFVGYPLFVAGCAGYDVTFGQLVVVALLVLIASVGTPAAPGAGAIILFTILSGLGYVNDSALLAYSLILAINRPIEMLLTALNVVGDSAASIYVAKSEGMLDETKYNA